MKTEAIRACVQFRKEYETDDGVHLAQRALTELAALKEERVKLRDACRLARGHCRGQVHLSATNPEEDWETERNMLEVILEAALKEEV